MFAQDYQRATCWFLSVSSFFSFDGFELAFDMNRFCCFLWRRNTLDQTFNFQGGKIKLTGIRKKGAANAKNFVKRTKKKTKISFLGTNIVPAPLLGETLELICCGFFFSLKIGQNHYHQHAFVTTFSWPDRLKVLKKGGKRKTVFRATNYPLTL